MLRTITKARLRPDGIMSATPADVANRVKPSIVFALGPASKQAMRRDAAGGDQPTGSAGSKILQLA